MKQRERYKKRKMAKELLNQDISLGGKQESFGEIMDWSFYSQFRKFQENSVKGAGK